MPVLNANRASAAILYSARHCPSLLAAFNVSPDERWLTGRGATERDLHVWDTASGEPVAHIQELGSLNSLDLAVFSPDSEVLALATEKWEVKLWDTGVLSAARPFRSRPCRE